MGGSPIAQVDALRPLLARVSISWRPVAGRGDPSTIRWPGEVHIGDFRVQDGEKVLFIGDSITDCGRRGEQAPLGNGYARMFGELVTARYPNRLVRYLNKGVGGNTVVDLRDRWPDDVLKQKPHWLSIHIGVNDLFHYLYGHDRAVDPALFEQTYDQILEVTTRELDCRVVLITPFYISTDRSGQTFRSRVLDLIPQYIRVVEKMSQKYGTLLLDLHDIFKEQLKYRDADAFCPEPVHPHQGGHMVIASSLMDVLSE
jgi:lysophospholipase L1-like esterase